MNDVYAEFDRSSPIENITDKLNLGELQVYGISTKFTVESTKNYR